MQGKRFVRLDGLRGVAALMVAVNHSFYVLKLDGVADIWRRGWFDKDLGVLPRVTQAVMFLANGSMAVSLFFVLSGFVLGLSLDRLGVSWKGAGRFWVRRLFRIYPLYIFMLLVTFLWVGWGGAGVEREFTSEWLGWWPRFSVSGGELVKNLLFWSTSMSGVTWALKVEAAAAVWMPLLYWVSRRVDKLVDVPVLFGLLMVDLRLGRWAGLAFLYMFYLGLVIFKWRGLFVKMARLVEKRGWVVLAIIFAGLAARFVLSGWWVKWVEGGAAWLLIGFLAVAGKKHGSFLGRGLLQYLGKLSYSFYLFHFLVLYAVAGYVLANVSEAWLMDHAFLVHVVIAAVSVLLTVLLSQATYYWIERPGVAIGRRLTGGKRERKLA